MSERRQFGNKGKKWLQPIQEDQQYIGHSLQPGTPQLEGASPRRGQFQLHSRGGFQPGQDLFQREGSPQGRPLRRGRQLVEIPDGKRPAGGILRQVLRGGAVGTAAAGGGVHRQDQTAFLLDQRLQKRLPQPERTLVLKLEKCLQMQGVRVFRHLHRGQHPADPALSRGEPVGQGALEAALCERLAQS